MSQSASLDGSLSVNLINNYTPPQGDSYQVLTFASETGNFSAEFGLYLGGGEGFTPTFSPSTNPTALDLLAVSESAGTQTTVQSSENPSNFGDAVTFTATVTPTISTSLVPTGQVTFYVGSTAVDTTTLQSGSATYVTATLAVGTHSITVQYGGDNNFSGSNSTALTQTVSPVTDFWTGASAAEGGNDNWSNPANWSLGTPPTTVEMADFTASESQYAASNVDTSFSIADLTIDSTWGGSVDVTQPLTISGNLILASGALGGSAAVSVAGSGSQFSGGTLSGNVTNLGTLTVTTSGVALAGTLTNAGSIVVDTGVIVYQGSTSSGDSIVNEAGATLTFRAPPTSATPTLTGMSTTAAPLLTPARWRSPQAAAQRPSPTRSPTRAPSWSTPPRSIQRARSPEPTPRSPSHRAPTS